MEFNLADLWEGVVDAVPDHEALVCGPRRLTYAEADARMNRLAHVLASRGIGAGDHVARYLYNGTEYLEGMLAAYKLRAVPINVNYRYVAEELRYLLDDSDARAVVFDRTFAPTLASVAPSLPGLRTRLVVEDGSDADLAGLDAVDYDAALAEASPTRDFGPRSADDLYILYTGGTTGMPKGVMWRQEDIFFGAFGGGGVDKPITRPDEIGEPLAPVGCAACPPARSCTAGALDGLPHPVRGRDHRDLARPVDGPHAGVGTCVGRARELPGHRRRRDGPAPRGGARSAPDGVDLSGLALLLSGGAILSPPVKQALAAAAAHHPARRLRQLRGGRPGPDGRRRRRRDVHAAPIA